MGSGLILLVIVGAWLAVLVPMALRGHETSASLTSVDRFSDAMRVLSRREERRTVVLPPRPASAPSVAERRRRTLLVLVGSALLSLGLALFGVPLLLGVHVVCDLLLVGFVVHLRRQAILKAQRSARQRARHMTAAPVAAAAAPPAPRAPRVTGIPDRMPRRPEPLGITLPAPAARYDEATVAMDTSWSPVPVPPPVYVGKPAAPSRPPRVLDLTKPGEWSATLEDAGLDILDEGPELEEILDRRRVSGGW